MSDKTENLILQFFKLIMNCEVTIEEIRKDLAKKKINLRDIFKAINKNQSGVIIPSQLKEYMNSFNIIVFNDKDIEFLTDRIDLSGNARITFKEFTSDLTPSD